MPALLFRRAFSTSRAAIFAGVLALMGASQASAATYFVRTDGGDATQCTGRANGAYPGTGTGRACAWKSPHYALPASGAARIAGGDTLYIGAGEYMIGVNAPGANGGPCAAAYPYDCNLGAVPSGPDSGHRTRILGLQPSLNCTVGTAPPGSHRRPVEGCSVSAPIPPAALLVTPLADVGRENGTCTVAPRLWGTQRVSKIINLEGSSNVEIGCLEITDKSDCVEFHVDPAVRCQRDTAPYGDWASTGISARASRNVWLHDLNIHGLANRGMLAGGLTDWTLDRVRIIANGWAGWDGDIGPGSSNAGRMLLRHISVAWNGCGQRWQSGEIHGCWAQEEGGYGDGIGTATTGGQWVIEDSYVHHNTSDGIDLLYLDGAANTSMVVRRVLAVGNAGNQIKASGTALIENSVIIGQCSYFNGRYRMSSGDLCRALGNAVSLALSNSQTATLRYNTIIGEGDCLILSTSGNSASRLVIQNNALLGQLDWRANLQGNAGELACGHYADNSPATVAFSGNAFWNLKGNPCPAGGNLCGQNPLLANSAMATFDPTPQPGSPLLDRAVVIPDVRTDYTLQLRPSGNGPDIGAVERTNGARARPPRLGALAFSAPVRAANGDYAVEGADGTSAYGPSVGRAYTTSVVGDYDGDGYPDVLWSDGSRVLLAMNDRAGSFRVGAPVLHDRSWRPVAAPDVDGDGVSDVLWRSGVALVAWRMKDGEVVASMPAGNVSANDRLVGSTDLDADGVSDLAWWNGTRVAMQLGDGQGHYRTAWAGGDLRGWVPTGFSEPQADGGIGLQWSRGSYRASWSLAGATPVSATLVEVAKAVDSRSAGAISRARIAAPPSDSH